MKKIMVLFTMLMIIMSTSVFASSSQSKGDVNWENSTIEGVGVGVAPPTALNPGHAKALARRAAIVNAYRALAETAQGVTIDGETTVENLMVTNEVTKTKISAVVKGAEIIKEDYDGNGMYTVTMRVKLYGVSNSIASAVMPQTNVIEPLPTPNTNTSTPTRLNASGAYTGVVIDCRGLNLSPAMSPVIKNASGQPIYGYKNLDYDYVVSNGMAGYSKDINTHPRAGANPLIVKAIGVDNHNTYPIVSDEDANKILVENSATGFLNRCAVVFVR